MIRYRLKRAVLVKLSRIEAKLDSFAKMRNGRLNMLFLVFSGCESLDSGGIAAELSRIRPAGQGFLNVGDRKGERAARPTCREEGEIEDSSIMKGRRRVGLEFE